MLRRGPGLNIVSSFVWQKFWELAKQVNEFMTWKKVECPFEKDRKILQYLHTAPIFSEDGKHIPSCLNHILLAIYLFIILYRASAAEGICQCLYACWNMITVGFWSLALLQIVEPQIADVHAWTWAISRLVLNC